MKVYQIYCREGSMDPCLGYDSREYPIRGLYVSKEIAIKHLPHNSYSYGESCKYFIKEIDVIES